jgi:hypothetical protein
LEKKDIVKTYERNIKELTHRINKLELTANKPKATQNFPLTNSQQSKQSTNTTKKMVSNIQKGKIQNNLKSSSQAENRSRSKEKMFSNNSGSNQNLRASSANKNSKGSKKSPSITKISGGTPKEKPKSKKKILKNSSSGNRSREDLLKSQYDIQRSQQTTSPRMSGRVLSPVSRAGDTSLNSIGCNFLMSPTGIQNFEFEKGMNQQNYQNPNLNHQYNYEMNSNQDNSRGEKLNQINNTIFDLERNIADLNRNYKNLMIKLNVKNKYKHFF